jgi:hypothetical protein
MTVMGLMQFVEAPSDAAEIDESAQIFADRYRQRVLLPTIPHIEKPSQ